MDLIYILKIVIGILSAGALLALIFLLIEIVRIFTKIRRIVERVELLTDIKGWFTLFRKFSRKDKK